MKAHRIKVCLVSCLALTAAATAFAVPPRSFTYQGQLKQGGQPMNGTPHMTFTLFDAATGGPTIASEQMDVPVTDGLFTVTLNANNNYPAIAFDGTPRWLEIRVGNTILTPRQPITSAPYAAYAFDGPAVSSLDAPDGNPVNALIVANDGKVGIGTTGPKGLLDVEGDYYGKGHLWLHAYEGDGQSGTAFVQARDDSTTSAIAMQLRTKNGNTLTDAMRLTPDGNVGIGTTAPVGKLCVLGGSTTTNGTYGFTGVSQGTPPTNTYISAPGPGSTLGFTTSAIERMRIASDGSIGIGTTTPAAMLHLKNGNLRIDDGQIQSWGPIVLHPDVDQSGDDVVQFLNAEGNVTFSVAANGYVGVGTSTPQAALDVVGRTRTGSLEITGGSDLAEPFNVNDVAQAQPGMVVCIDRNRVGELTVSSKAYDTSVAGIISGANGINVGLMLKQDGSIAAGQHPVAMTGRVWCWVDAINGAVQPGDLLTTSDTAGHAMKVSDHSRAGGAIIGKAMSALESGKGLVLVLVNLQ